MLISSHNKNPLINLERKDWNHQNPQIFIGSKFPHNAWKICMKHENKWKRRGKKVLPVLEEKNPWNILRENDKKYCFESWPIEEREKELLKRFE